LVYTESTYPYPDIDSFKDERVKELYRNEPVIDEHGVAGEELPALPHSHDHA